MSGIPADVIGEIILKMLTKYPQLFTSNYTLADIFTFVRLNTTVLSIIVNATGVEGQTIEEAIDLYLTVAQYLQPTSTATPPTNATNSTPPCVPEYSQGLLTSFSILPALFILLLLSYLNRRRRTLTLCGQIITRPGLCIPVNLVDSYENRFAFACAFAATTSKCLTILFLGTFEEIFSPEFNEWIQRPEVPSFTAIIWRIIAMLIIGVAYYPLFACMATDYKMTGYVIGLLYSGMWIIFSVSFFWQCPSYKTAVFPGDILASEMPVYLCLAFLFFKYLWLLVTTMYTRYNPSARPKDEENEWMTFYKYRYVVKLLEPIPKEEREPVSFREKVKGKLYKWRPEFKYSTRVVCTYFISFIGIYQILLLFFVLGGLLLRFRDVIKENPFFEVGDGRQWFLIGAVSMFVAVGISAIYSAVLVANMLSWYRGHLLRLQRGEKEFLPIEIFNRNPSSITVATLKYSGFQVAYLCWGSIVSVVTLTLVGFVVGQQLIMPIVNGRLDSFALLKLQDLWPAVVISLVFYWIQLLLAKYAFLIDRETTMALDNRRLFHVCTYFLFFFNIFLGFISCLKRVIIGAVLGVMFLGRTQKSVLSRDFELSDPGFNAYVGYLLLEHTHSNPVLVTFCRLLIKTMIDRETDLVDGESSVGGNHVVEGCDNNQVSIELNTRILRHRYSRRIRNRWLLLLTLHNNPSLQEHRRQEMFSERSPFAAFGVMIQRGAEKLNQTLENEREGNDYDIKL